MSTKEQEPQLNWNEQLSQKVRQRCIELLQLIANGESMKQAATTMGYSYDGSKCALQRFYAEIGADSLGHALVIAFRRGLIS